MRSFCWLGWLTVLQPNAFGRGVKSVTTGVLHDRKPSDPLVADPWDLLGASVSQFSGNAQSCLFFLPHPNLQGTYLTQ